MSETEATLVLIGVALYALASGIGALAQHGINKPLPRRPPLGLDTRCGCGCYRLLTRPPYMLAGRCQALLESRAARAGVSPVAEGALQLKARHVRVGDRVGFDGEATVRSLDDAYDGTHVRFVTDRGELCCDQLAQIDVFRDEAVS